MVPILRSSQSPQKRKDPPLCRTHKSVKKTGSLEFRHTEIKGKQKETGHSK